MIGPRSEIETAVPNATLHGPRPHPTPDEQHAVNVIAFTFVTFALVGFSATLASLATLAYLGPWGSP